MSVVFPRTDYNEREEWERGRVTYAVSLENNVVLLAKLNDRTLLAPRMKFDLVDSGCLAGVDEFLEVLETAVGINAKEEAFWSASSKPCFS